MHESVQQRLLELNHQFYETIAPAFNETRRVWTPGLVQLLDYLPSATDDSPLTALDVGCGNGRFARILDSRSLSFLYVGIDGSTELLSKAIQNTAELTNGRALFLETDFANTNWSTKLLKLEPLSGHHSDARFNFVLCTATLQHLPGYNLRLQVVREMAKVAVNCLALSAWQFLESPRLRVKQLEWESVGLTAQDVEFGDALLPWKQGRYAIRYVHQLDEVELRNLARDADLVVTDTFRADGREGNLNLYIMLQKSHGQN